MMLTAMIGTYSFDQRVQDFAILIGVAVAVLVMLLVLYRRKRS